MEGAKNHSPLCIISWVPRITWCTAWYEKLETLARCEKLIGYNALKQLLSSSTA